MSASPPPPDPASGGPIPSSLRAAVRFLTVVPLPYHPSEDDSPPSAALVWFPIVGLAIGAVVAITLLLPLPAVAGGALALAVWTLVTGGLHEDGFLDCADAAAAPVPPARRREILKDPHVGSHAVTAGGLLLVLRLAALASVPPLAALVAPVIGRWCMTLTLALVPPGAPGPAASAAGAEGGREAGLGSAFGDGARAGPPTGVAVALLVALVVGSGRLSVAGAVTLATLLGISMGLATARWLGDRVGGTPGDVHGAAGIVAETAALWAFLTIP